MKYLLAHCITWLQVLILTVLWFSYPQYTGYATQPGPEIPAGFSLIDSAPGIELYRKDYQSGNPDFVQIIHLDLGARLQLMHGQITEARPEAGAYGGPDPRFRSQSLQSYWQDLATISQAGGETPFCVLNGQFFYMLEYPTRLPFPLKVDGEIITEGYGLSDFPDQKLMMELWSDHASISRLKSEALHGSTAPNIISGLSESANKRSQHYTGRTFVGTDDLDGDDRYEIVLTFTTKTARQVDAARVLRDFGAEQVMMLDGGGSAQLSCQGDNLVVSERVLPQVVGVLAASPDYQPLQMIENPNPERQEKVFDGTFPASKAGTQVDTRTSPTTGIGPDPAANLALSQSGGQTQLTQPPAQSEPVAQTPGDVARAEDILALDIILVPLFMGPGLLIILLTILRQQFHT